MEKNGNKVIRVLEVMAIMFSVITGGASVGILVWKGGAMAHMIDTHEERLKSIEMRGSPTMDTHVKLDDEREKRTKERLEQLEKIYAVALDMRSDLSRLTQKVDDLKEQLLKK